MADQGTPPIAEQTLEPGLAPSLSPKAEDVSETPAVRENQVDHVLQDYLNQLLIVATEKPSVAKATPKVEVPVQEVIEVAVDVAVETEIQSWDIYPESTEALPETELIQTADNEIQIQESINTPAQLSQQLDWNSSRGVDCLIFKVAGLKLAIPLPLLGGVYTVNNKVTPLFGQAKWSLGVWQSEDQKLTVVDSAQLIMPERGVSLQEEGYQYLIQLDRAPWALACQEICDTRDLVSESIKWRGDTSKRPWLAGTVISEMCALIDVPGLLSLLESRG